MRSRALVGDNKNMSDSPDFIDLIFQFLSYHSYNIILWWFWLTQSRSHTIPAGLSSTLSSSIWTSYSEAHPSELHILKFQGDGVQCEESELWLRVCGRVREEEQEFDEASAGRSSEILTHSSCLTSLRGPGKRVPAFLIIPTGRWLGDIPILGDGSPIMGQRPPSPLIDQNYQFIAPKASEGWLHCIAFLWDRTTTCLWWFSGVNRIKINKNNAFIRGFETVSYLLEGEFTHEDFLGHRGVLKVDKDGVILLKMTRLSKWKLCFWTWWQQWCW